MGELAAGRETGSSQFSRREMRVVIMIMTSSPAKELAPHRGAGV